MSNGTITIQGFSPSDKVPQVFGQTLTGQGPVAAGSIPFLLLLVGIMSASAGNATPNTQVVPITQLSDADTAWGTGVQITRMCQAAIQANPGAQIYGIGVPKASGAVAAQAAITIMGSSSWTVGGNFTYRIAGVSRTVSIGPSDSISQVATNIAADANSVYELPVTAAAVQVGATTTYQVVFTHLSPGASGNQQLLALDASEVPSGFVSNITGPIWVLTTATLTGQYVVPTTANGFYYVCTVAGTTNSTQPTWPTTVGTTVTDGTVTWTCAGAILTGGIIPFNRGSGVESVSAALATIATAQFDRIGIGQNDATNLGLWKTQLDSQSGPLTNILQQAVCSTNGTSAAAQTLAQTTLNDGQFELVRVINSETHPSEIAASHASTRLVEQGCPATFYNYAPLVAVAAQSQRADWPNHSTLVSDLNAGVSPGTTTADAVCRVVRAITTLSLNGSVPTYGTLDVAQRSVPDAFRAYLTIDWTQDYAVQNPAVEPDPLPGERYPSTGVATPSLWNARVYGYLKDWEAGTGFPYPQIQQVDTHLPVSYWDVARKCIMTAAPVLAVYNNAQLGVSVRGQTQ